MNAQLPALVVDPELYPTSIEKSVDRWVHVVGLSGAALGERMDVEELFKEMIAFNGGLPLCRA